MIISIEGTPMLVGIIMFYENILNFITNVRDACKNHYVVIHANKIYMNYVVEGRIALQQIKFCCCVMINLKQFTCPGEINTSLSF